MNTADITRRANEIRPEAMKVKRDLFHSLVKDLSLEKIKKGITEFYNVSNTVEQLQPESIKEAIKDFLSSDQLTRESALEVLCGMFNETINLDMIKYIRNGKSNDISKNYIEKIKEISRE